MFRRFLSEIGYFILKKEMEETDFLEVRMRSFCISVKSVASEHLTKRLYKGDSVY